MKPALLFCFVIVCSVRELAAAAASLPVAGSASHLFVDGADAGAVLSWDGGDFRATAIAAAGVGGKRPGSPVLAPVVMTVAFPPSAPLAAWITEMAAGGAPRRTLLLVDSDMSRRPVEGYEVSGAMLTEVVFPVFDASASAFGPMKLVFSGAHGGVVSKLPQAAIGPAPKATTTFQLSVAGLDGRGVSRIEGLAIRQSVPGPARGGDDFVRQGVAGPTEIANARITLSRATAPGWRAWHNDFVVTAAGPEAKTREGVIGLLGPTGQPGPISLVLTGCGILSLSRPTETVGVAPRFVAEMFIERIAFTGLPPVVGGPKAATVPPAPPAEKTEQPANPTSPADKGLRDPAEFPRVADLVRTSYSGNYDKTYTSEQANYTAAESANSLLARVTEAAKGARWELRTLDENEGSGARQIHQRWVRDKASATLTISEKADVKGSQLQLQVHVTIPPP